MLPEYKAVLWADLRINPYILPHIYKTELTGVYSFKKQENCEEGSGGEVCKVKTSVLE